MITNKKHKLIIKEKEEQIAELRQKLVESRNLKEILNKLSSITVNGLSFSDCNGSWTVDTTYISDDVAVYVEDILGGKVLKQEGTKCIVVDTDGTIKTGLTKQNPDKGFNYKLVRNN